MYLIIILMCAGGLQAAYDTVMEEDTLPPPYQHSLEMLRTSETKLRKHIIKDKLPVDHPERQYALLLAVLSDAADAIASSCLELNSTHVFYDSLDTQISVAWLHPVSVSKRLKQFLDKTFLYTRDLRYFVEAFCNKTRVDERNCDSLVDKAVKEDPERYAKQAELLLQMAGLAEYVVNNEPTIENAAVNHSLIHIMFAHVNEMVDFIEKLAQVIKVLYRPNYTCVGHA